MKNGLNANENSYTKVSRVYNNCECNYKNKRKSGYGASKILIRGQHMVIFNSEPWGLFFLPVFSKTDLK